MQGGGLSVSMCARERVRGKQLTKLGVGWEPPKERAYN